MRRTHLPDRTPFRGHESGILALCSGCSVSAVHDGELVPADRGTVHVLLLLQACTCFLRWSDTLARGVRRSPAAVDVRASMWVRPAMALWAALAVALSDTGIRANRAEPLRSVQATAIGLAILLVLLPWWVRNGGLYGRFVPFSTSGEITAIEAVRMDVAVQLPLPWQEETPRADRRTGADGESRRSGAFSRRCGVQQ